MVFFQGRLICQRYLQLGSLEEAIGLDEKSQQLILSHAVKIMFEESVDVKGSVFYSKTLITWHIYAFTLTHLKLRRFWVLSVMVKVCFINDDQTCFVKDLHSSCWHPGCLRLCHFVKINWHSVWNLQEASTKIVHSRIQATVITDL